VKEREFQRNEREENCPIRDFKGGCVLSQIVVRLHKIWLGKLIIMLKANRKLSKGVNLTIKESNTNSLPIS